MYTDRNSFVLVFPHIHDFEFLYLDPESRVILRSPEEELGPDRYINANYIRVRVSQCLFDPGCFV